MFNHVSGEFQTIRPANRNAHDRVADLNGHVAPALKERVGDLASTETDG